MMNSMPVALILAHRAAIQEARSALPHAPVVPHVDRISVVQRTRKATASGLRRAADVLAPSRPVKATPARAVVRREAC
jgi:hypothetical protein